MAGLKRYALSLQLRGYILSESAGPPEFGVLSLEVIADPVSAQAKDKSRKHALVSEVRKRTLAFDYLLSGEIKVDIEWLVHEQIRWETDAAPDVDGILKPLLDGLCGPDGVMIDDSQVQEVSCRWIDHGARHTQRLKFELRYGPDDWIAKAGLVFVHFRNSLCFPFHTDLRPEAVAVLLEAAQAALDARDKLMADGLDYYDARYVMPVQRFFHKSRVADRFKVYELAEFHRRFAAPAP